MQRSMAKAERLREMERLYFQRAYSDIEMGERLSVDRTTVYRDRIELERELPFFQDEDGRWAIDRSRYLSNIRVNLSEALSLYLAARRTSQQTRFAQTHVATALEKLALTLRQPMTERLVRAADRILAQRQDPTRAAVFETVAAAWIEGRELRLVYRALRGETERVHRFAPYLLEPSPWNEGVYLIGQSDLAPQVITLKLDRIVGAKLLGPFEAPPDFDEEKMLRHAWGIWGSEQTPQMVKLRFAPGLATRRLKETIWHPLEKLTDLEDGGCLWEAPIAEWQEMLPWIRGWGADLEVVEPMELRESLLREVRSMSELYRMPLASGFPYQQLYAKTARAGDGFHPLLYHLLDVGQVAQELWRVALSPATRRWAALVLQVEEEAAGRFVAFMAALHDLGKAGPAYQSKYANDAIRRRLSDAGFELVRLEYSTDTQQLVPHGTVSTWALTPLLAELHGMSRRFARLLAVAVGGHHGRWPDLRMTDRLDDSACALWDEARRDLFWEVCGVFQPPPVQMPTDKVERNAFLTFLSAVTSVADWVGSREEDFPFVEEVLPTRRYAVRTARQARTALARLGWAGVQASGATKSLTELFPEITTPNPIQAQTLQMASTVALPALVILEAPTGIGKTEAALTLADAWSRLGEARGIYVAMPTQATSNQMFERVVKFLQQAYPDGFVNVNLAHSQARLNAQLIDLHLTTIGEQESDRLAAMSWFMEQSKRALLAPFGVGTVDQALLSILQTKHFFVRLFGLQHKVVILDEVHAYDTYMSTLLDRLLAWLRALGTSVVILSATLPDATRLRLVKAYTAALPAGENDVYPRLTVAPAGLPPEAFSLPAPEDIPIEIAWLHDDPDGLIALLAEQLAEGGCAAVICNTVRRAQALYLALRAAALPPDTDLVLFHARFPPAWRKETEEQILHWFGKPRCDRPHARPTRAIVVATQVIEQSLDLDFDVMISELAPIDLLIQRAGRLHRHARGPRRHPRRLTILRPQLDSNGLPQFGASSFVYAPYVLLQTYLALQARTSLNLPSDTRALINAVYANDIPQHPNSYWQDALQQAHRDLQSEKQKAEAKAKQVRVLPPNSDELLSQSLLGLEEDNPAIHDSFQAHTRDIGPTVGLVALYETEQGLSLEPDGTQVIRLEQPLTTDTTLLLDRYVMNVQHWAAVRHLVEQSAPAAWRKSARLRYCRAIVLGKEGYRFRVGEEGSYVVRLDRELGLEIQKEEA